MPTVATPPCTFTHSWVFVNRTFFGRSAMVALPARGRGPRGLPRSLVEGSLHHLHRVALVADVHLEARADRGVGGRDEPRGDVLPEGRARGAARDLPEQAVLVVERGALAGHARRVRHERDELSREPPRLEGLRRGDADRAVLREVEAEVEARLERRDVEVDLVPVERHPSLEAQRVPRPEP